MHPPVDRSKLTTERRCPASADLDAMDTPGVLRVIHEADRGVADAVGAVLPRLAGLVDAAVDAMERGGRLIYLGAGTSGRLGVLDASEVPPTFHEDLGRVVGVIAGGDASLRRSSEGMEDDPGGAVAELERAVGAGEDAHLKSRNSDRESPISDLNSEISNLKSETSDFKSQISKFELEISTPRPHLLLGIAAGGTTPYVHGGLRWAKRRGLTTALLCCVEEAELRAALNSVEHIDHLLCVPVGPEVVTGSTRMKAGTATKMVLNMLSTAVMVRRGKTWGHLMVDLRATNIKLRDRGTRLLVEQCDLSYQEAGELLDAAGGRVKRAVVMALLGVAAEEADRLLDAAGGRLREVVGPPK